MNLNNAVNLIMSEYRAKLSKAKENYRVALSRHKELYEAEKKLRALILDGAEDSEIKVAEDTKRDVIRSLGYSDEHFDPLPACEKCGDSGYVNGVYCDCVRKRAGRETLGHSAPPFTFDTSDLSVFSKDAKEMAEITYAKMKIFCEKFPHTKNINVLLFGNVGVGKTYLASCVANELERKGFNTLFLSAFKFNDLCLKYHTSFDNSRADGLNAVLDADLLVIDDLGTESVLKNVTLEYLYTVISERMNGGKHTIITTNLNTEQLGLRYGERIHSRLFSERVCLTTELIGKDLRR